MTTLGPFYGTLTDPAGNRQVFAPDGVHLVLADAPAPDPAPEPMPSPVPAGANTVRIGVSTFPLAAVDPTASSNPPGAPYDGARGPGQLVAYTTGRATVTNAHGREAQVSGGVVVGTSVNKTQIPTKGLVLSGHGAAATWLATHARTGSRVEFTTTTPAPVPEPTPVPGPGSPSGRTVAIYRKDGSGSTARIPAGVNQFRYAFFQGSGLVEWGGEDVGTQAANLGKWLDADPSRRLLISAGGSKGSVSTSNRGAFLGAFLAAEAKLGGRVTGIDWDLEQSAMVVADVVAISKSLAAGREDSYLISFAPPGGSPVPLALTAATALHRAGYRVQFGQQLYEAPSYIDQATALAALDRAIGTDAIPPSCVLLGTMVSGDQRHWAIDMCVQVLKAAVAKWPDLGGTYLWSEGNESQDAEWARRMAAVLE